MNEIIIDSGLSQSRVAMLEHGELVEYYIEGKDIKRLVGDIYKGRVTNVLPGMQAAFVDIGFEKNAFLYVKDALPRDIIINNDISNKDISIKDVVKNGEEIIVQVIKEPIDSKGPRITKHLSFPGRYVVLMPFMDYVGISRRIENEAERSRLKEMANELRPPNMGLIMRTEAENRNVEDIKDDLRYLLRLWNKILKEQNLGFAPKVIYRDLDLVHRTIRDMFTDETKKMIINDKDTFDKATSFIELISPHLKDRIEYYESENNIFGFYGIEKMIQNALSRKVWLKSGGYIVIDKTEAMTVIDVNTGKYVGVKDLEDTIFKINKEAAKEIAKQLRLRDIGGIIIIDFIDMDDKKVKQKLINMLSNELEKDRVRTSILGITQLGLLEMTRKKVRNRISSILEQECPYCDGSGKVYSIEMMISLLEKELKRISIHTNSEAVVIEMSPKVLSSLNNNKMTLIEEMEKEFNLTIFLMDNKEMHFNRFEIKYMGRKNNAEEVFKKGC